ncbi:MAG: glycosyltransferase [Candidatus Aenigmatarchaeota archaeon]
MKVSLVCTVFNEENNIREFLESVMNQTKKPDEFIIVDGGSTDKTVEIIKKYVKAKWIKLIVSRGASIGKGRNIAIKKAKNEIIAVTDCGCILDKNWLKNITKPFKNKNIDVVVGIYRPYYTNDFEYFQGLVIVKNEEIFLNPSRMSSRSIALKKSVWKEVGGYPDSKVGEDTEFNLKLLEKGYKFAFAKNAVVYWRMRKNWKEFFKQFYRYGIGDKKSGNIWKMKKNAFFIFSFFGYLALILVFIFINYTYSLFLLFLGLFYFILEGIKIAIKSKSIKGFFYGFLLNLIKRIAYCMGCLAGS